MSAKPGAIVAGTGFGGRVHVPALRAAGFEVIALVGRDPQRTRRRAERLGVPKALTSFDEALAMPGVQAVTIATPPPSHAALAIASVKAGKHVICEKPFATDATEATSMLDAASTAGVTHLVGHEFRWATDRALVQRVLARGGVGEPRFATFLHYGPLVADPAARVPPWWFDGRRGGGWLGASGSHVVDQVRTWMGEFESVSARLALVSGREADAEDSFVIRFRLTSGVDGVLQQTAGAWGPALDVARVAGSAGTVWLERGRAFLARPSGVEQLDPPDDLRLPPPPTASDDPRDRFTHLELGPYTRLCEVLRAGVDGRPPAASVAPPTFADGLAVTRVLDAVRESERRRGAQVVVDRS